MTHVFFSYRRGNRLAGGILTSVKNPLIKKTLGVILILLGILALVTPLTPGAWLIFIGLEVFGIRLVAWDRVKAWWQGRKAKDEPPTPDPST